MQKILLLQKGSNSELLAPDANTLPMSYALLLIRSVVVPGEDLELEDWSPNVILM